MFFLIYFLFFEGTKIDKSVLLCKLLACLFIDLFSYIDHWIK